MEQIAAYFFQSEFTTRFLIARGDAFQSFFSDIMRAAHLGDFVPVRALGRHGDDKCDGYLKSSGVLFQVHAPDGRFDEKETLDRAIAKIKTDFAGAVAKWPGFMRDWIYVHNSYEGIPAKVLHTLLALEKDAQDGIRTSQWGYGELKEKTLQLHPSKLISMFGYPPSQSASLDMQMDHIREVVERIAVENEPAATEPITKVPSDKLEYNNLSLASRKLLELGMQKARLVEDYFSKHVDPTFGDRVASTFTSEYEKQRSLHTNPDEIFGLLEHFASGGSHSSPQETTAILAVIAHLFESCDIFERPPVEV